jgi:hypothetical protein
MTVRFLFFRAAVWLLVFLGLFTGALIVLFETGALTPYVVESLDARLRPAGLSFRAGSIQWRPWSGLGVHEATLETLPAQGGAVRARHAVSIRRIDVGYRLMDLARGDLHVARIRILQPDIDLDALLDWSEELSGAGGGGASFRIDDIALTEGRVRARDGDLLSGLTLRGSLEVAPGEWRLALAEQRGRLRLGRFDEDVAVHGGLLLSQGILHLDGLRIATAGGTMGLDGFLDPRGVRPSRVVVEAAAIPLEKVGEWLDVEHPLLFATLDFDAVVDGSRDSLRVAADLVGRGRDDLERRIGIAGLRVGNHVALERFRYEAGSSRLDLSGDLHLGDGTRIEGVAVFRDLEPAVLLADSDLDVLQDLDGTVRFEGQGLTRATFRGGVDIHLDGATAFGLRFESSALRGRLDRGALEVEDARFRVAGSELRGHGTIDRDNVVEAELRGDLADLAVLEQIGGAVRRAEPSGHGSVTVRVAGPVKAPEFDAMLRLEDASVAGLDAGSLEITAESLQLGATRVDFRAEGFDIGQGERRFDRVVAEGWSEADILELRSLEAETAAAILSLAGRLDFGQEGRLDALVDRLRLRAKDGSSDWTNGGAVRVARTGGAVTVTGLDLRGEGGSVSGDVTVLPGGAMSVRAVGRAVDLELFAPLLGRDVAMDGLADFEGSAVVGADTLGVDVRLSLRDGRFGDHRVQALAGRVVAGETVVLEGISVATPELEGTLDGTLIPPPGSLRDALFDREARVRALEGTTLRGVRANVASSDFGWLWSRIPKAPVTGGEGAVGARLDGPFLRPTAHLSAQVTGGSVGSEPLDSFVVSADFDGEALILRDGLLRTGEDSLTVSGVVPLEWTAADPRPRLRAGRALDLRLEAKDLPLQTLSRTISLFQILHGSADASLALSGEPGSLRFGGAFSVTGGRLTIPTFDEPLVNGTAQGVFDEQGILLESGASRTDGAGS